MSMTLRIVAAAAALLLSPVPARADVALEWNELTTRTLVTQGQSPFAQARLAAIVQLAVFEAVNAVTGDYEPYIGIVAPVNTSADAAAITAAYRVLETYFPTAPLIDDAFAAGLAAIPNGTAKTNGIDVGERAAAAMILRRASDPTSPTISPVGTPEAGVWQVTPAPGCLATATGGSFYNWRDIPPFGVPDVAAFIPGPPPGLASSAFTKDYNEVKAVGGAGSTQRPADRADVARFYATTSPTWALNLAVRQLAAASPHTSLSENARALALLNMASSDALVTSFATKYTYNFWRPVTAIRSLDDFGNTKIEPDTAFAPYVPTPCFPSYPSNHASGTSGGAEIVRRIYGASGHDITMTNPLNAGVASMTLHYSSIDDICSDVDDARVYGGIHFRFDQDAGNVLGRQIATEVYKNNLRKAHAAE
jgi:hypothetical protein